MPTFDDVTGLGVLLGACALAGLAAGLGVFVFVRRVGERVEEASKTTPTGSRRRAPRRGGFSYGIMVSLLPPFVLISRGLPMGKTRVKLAREYSRAGFPGGLDDDELPGVALMAGGMVALLCILLLLLATAALIDPPTALLVAPLGALAAFLGPGMVSGSLARQAAARDLDISRTMPFVLDLLVLTMRAGAPLNQALERVVIDYAGHPIGTEFSAVLTDMEMGVTKSLALENLAERNPIPAIRTFADDLNQAEELGRPVADTLERLSDRSRKQRVQDATEMAGKAKVLVLVPGMLVFIATLILLFAPFAVRYFYGGYTEF